MSQTTPDPGPSPTPEASASTVAKTKCPHCGEMRGARVKRRGFFQKEILPFFGYFPWECGACRFAWVSTLRGERRKRRIGKGPKSYKEPTSGSMYPRQSLTFKPTVPQEEPKPTQTHFDNRFEDDTHEDVG